MNNFKIPRDDNHIALQLTPNQVALAVTYDTTISSATDLTLNASTSIIEVIAIDNGIFMRYSATASSSNFDEFIAAGMTRHYVIPPNVTVVSFIEETASAKLVVIEK